MKMWQGISTTRRTIGTRMEAGGGYGCLNDSTTMLHVTRLRSGSFTVVDRCLAYSLTPPLCSSRNTRSPSLLFATLRGIPPPIVALTRGAAIS
jgi:hypothetical protein